MTNDFNFTNMRNFNLPLLASSLLFSPLLASCDDDDVFFRQAQTPDLVDWDGNVLRNVRLASTGYYDYSYDDYGIINGFAIEGGDFAGLVQNPFSIDLSGRTFSDTYSISLDDSGLVRSIRNSYSGSDVDDDGDDYSYSGHHYFSFRYNGLQQIRSVSVTTSEMLTYSQSSQILSSSESYSFYYDDDDAITRMDGTIRQSNVSLGYNVSTSLVAKFRDVELFNPYGLYTPSYANVAFNDVVAEGLALIGLLGRASTYLPSGCVVSQEVSSTYDGVSSSDSFSDRVDFQVSLAADGLILDADDWQFSYYDDLDIVSTDYDVEESAVSPTCDVSHKASLRHLVRKQAL